MKKFLVVAMLSLLSVHCSQNLSNSVNSDSDESSHIINPIQPLNDQTEIARSTAFVVINPQGTTHNGCTGTIISNDTILTAAHCIRDGSQFQVVFSSIASITFEEKDASKIRDVTAVGSHMFFAFDKGENDIGFVKFSGGLPEGYKPVKLLTDTGLLHAQMTVIPAGYGMTSTLANDFGFLYQGEATLESTDLSQKALILDQTSGHGICYGDSGGPTFVRINGELYQIGVTSRVIPFSQDNYQTSCSNKSVIMNVSQYMDWINKNALN